jgi:hypothetical protein
LESIKLARKAVAAGKAWKFQAKDFQERKRLFSGGKGLLGVEKTFAAGRKAISAPKGLFPAPQESNSSLKAF